MAEHERLYGSQLDLGEDSAYFRIADPLANGRGDPPYLRSRLAGETMKSEAGQFDFSLVYYDPALKMPFVLFKPKAQ